ncbi:hypothetical protein RD792_003519, partial [Penstemon davidsonii]
ASITEGDAKLGPRVVMRYLIAGIAIMKNAFEIDPLHRHDVPRHQVKTFLTYSANVYVLQVICSLCGREQNVQQNCMNCGVCMGNYFCNKCKFFDDDVSKEQYHCDECGICRTGGKENFFHCSNCGLSLCCYWSQFLFDSMKNLTVLPCGHTMHLECLKEMELHHR